MSRSGPLSVVVEARDRASLLDAIVQATRIFLFDVAPGRYEAVVRRLR